MQLSKKLVDHRKQIIYSCPTVLRCTHSQKNITRQRGMESAFASFRVLPSLAGLKHWCRKLARLKLSTRWLPASQCLSAPSSLIDLCPLERFAASVFRFHYERWLHAGGRNDSDLERIGAEWWVQSRKVSSSEDVTALHYDNDQRLAEDFSVYLFPSLSTVTYITDHGTDSSSAAPTLVFDHVCEDDRKGKKVHSMLISRPVQDKHIVFEGTKLHGAPGNHEFQNAFVDCRSSAGGVVEDERITLLVNMWFETQPCAWELSRKHKIDLGLCESSEQVVNDFEFRPREVANVHYNDVRDGDGHTLLDYVPPGAEWREEQDSEEESEEDKNPEEDVHKSQWQCKDNCARQTSDEHVQGDEGINVVSLRIPRFAGLASDTCVIAFDAEGNECPAFVSASVNDDADEHKVEGTEQGPIQIHEDGMTRKRFKVE